MTDNETATLWSTEIEASADIATLCQSLFSKTPLVRHGLREGHELGERDAPFFVVVPFSDFDGFEAENSTAKVVVTIGILDREWIAFGTRGQRARGLESMERIECALRTLLGETSEPPSRWTAEYANPGPDFYVRSILFETDNLRTI